MALIRTILAALIAVSVAVLPATGQAIALPSADQLAADQLAMADQADMPCCPCCDKQADLKLTTCALKCIGVVGAVVPAATVTPFHSVDGVLLPIVDDPLHELLNAPPTHPPPA